MTQITNVSNRAYTNEPYDGAEPTKTSSFVNACTSIFYKIASLCCIDIEPRSPLIEFEPQEEELKSLPPHTEEYWKLSSGYGERLSTSVNINEGKYIKVDPDQKGSLELIQNLYGKEKIDNWLNIKEVEIESDGEKFIAPKVIIGEEQLLPPSEGACTGNCLVFLSHYFKAKVNGESTLNAVKSAAILFEKQVPDDAEIVQVFYKAIKDINFELEVHSSVLSEEELQKIANKTYLEYANKIVINLVSQPLGIKSISYIKTSLDKDEFSYSFNQLPKGGYIFGITKHYTVFIKKTKEGYFFDSNQGTTKVSLDELEIILFLRAMFYYEYVKNKPMINLQNKTVYFMQISPISSPESTSNLNLLEEPD